MLSMSSKSQIIDGKALAEEIKQQIRQEIVENKLQPNLAVVLIGDDPASHLYVRLKQKACQKLNIEFHKYLLEKDTTNKEVIKVIDFLNNDPQIDALLVQLPLPIHLDKDKILKAITPKKDVDCLNPVNIEKVMNGQSIIISPLVQSIIHLLESTGQDLTNKKVCLILKNNILTQTLEKILKDKNLIVEQVKPTDPELSQKTKKADILITAVGEPFFIKKGMIKEGVIIIDVGINKVADNMIVGDANYSEVFPKCSHITPVPGGVGPMTVAMLLKNVIKLHQIKNLS
jgi:methylenetetrahydrofolate dehydrogenase (NADP+)/methenyltetrahydrofolate cyclohydrolase